MPDQERTARSAKPKPPPEPDALVREQAGRYRSGDGRFTVRQDGGEWFVTDSQQANEFGLEMVLGPFATIALAREAMASQREHPAGTRPGAAIRPITSASRGQSSEKKPTGATPLRPPSASGKQPAVRSTSTRVPKATPPESKPSAKPPEPEPEPAVDYAPAPWRRTNDERDQVARAVREINDAWTSGHPERMRDLLDDEVVFVQPGFAGRETGRDRAVQSYREFVTEATLHRYVESDLTIDLSGHTAVASYAWTIEYTRKKRRHSESGRDLFVLDRVGTRWKLVWRLLLPDAEGSSKS
jgi:ketosteroid isomerase-like protein